jgi:hypothetical protein
MAGELTEEKVVELFEASVDRALKDDATKAGLEDLAKEGADVSVAAIRQDLLDSSGLVLNRTKTMQTAWRLAREDRRAAEVELFRGVLKWPLPMIYLLTIFTSGLASWFLPSLRWFTLIPLAIPAGIVYIEMSKSLGIFLARSTVERRARRRLGRSLDSQVVVAVRTLTNRRLTSFDTDFKIFDRRGLRQFADPDREVPTGASEELESLIASLDSGSIGLAGPRGCGKTTLIKSFTDGRSVLFDKERIGLTVAAPVRYDPREFILHLFASLCEQVLARRPEALLQGGARWAQARRRKRLSVLAGTTLICLIVGAILTFQIEAPTQQDAGIALLSVGTVFGFVWLAMAADLPDSLVFFSWALARVLDSSNPNIPPQTTLPIETVAKDYLRQIRFQQSQEASGSAEVSLPFGVGFGGGSSTTLARTPWTLPEAVEEFRRFAGALRDRFVVIGIDELDKMESDTAAREFLNNVKGVFGVEGCYFLVSVSEDAMSAFERRGLPMRDVFDSSFDEIQRIGYLDLPESREVLESRVTGVPVPFQCLCHCMAGGLPRDLIRTIREVTGHYDFETSENGEGRKGLGNLTRRLIEAEWQGKVAGAIAATRSMTPLQPWWLSTWLHEMDGERPDIDSLRQWTLKLSRDHSAWRGSKDDGKAQFHQIAVEMMSFNYYAATLLEFFSEQGIGANLKESGPNRALRPTVVAKLETLAQARQQFATDPRLAWKLVEQARASAKLTPW